MPSLFFPSVSPSLSPTLLPCQSGLELIALLACASGPFHILATLLAHCAVSSGLRQAQSCTDKSQKLPTQRLHNPSCPYTLTLSQPLYCQPTLFPTPNTHESDRVEVLSRSRCQRLLGSCPGTLIETWAGPVKAEAAVGPNNASPP